MLAFKTVHLTQQFILNTAVVKAGDAMLLSAAEIGANANTSIGCVITGCMEVQFFDHTHTTYLAGGYARPADFHTGCVVVGIEESDYACLSPTPEYTLETSLHELAEAETLEVATEYLAIIGGAVTIDGVAHPSMKVVQLSGVKTITAVGRTLVIPFNVLPKT